MQQQQPSSRKRPMTEDGAAKRQVQEVVDERTLHELSIANLRALLNPRADHVTLARHAAYEEDCARGGLLNNK